MVCYAKGPGAPGTVEWLPRRATNMAWSQYGALAASRKNAHPTSAGHGRRRSPSSVTTPPGDVTSMPT